MTGHLPKARDKNFTETGTKTRKDLTICQVF